VDNALHPDEMSAAQRLREVGRILGEALLRRRLRDFRNPKIVNGFGENRLDDMRPSRTHGPEPSRIGERP
jgi:hypothetical protein